MTDIELLELEDNGLMRLIDEAEDLHRKIYGSDLNNSGGNILTYRKNLALFMGYAKSRQHGK